MNRTLCLSFVLLAACGTPNTGEVDRFIQAMADQQCAWQFRCCTDLEIEQVDGRKFSTVEECIPYRVLALTQQLHLNRLAVREGRLTVDAVKRNACLSQMEARACNPKPGQPQPTPDPNDPMAMDACVDVFVGTTRVGDECIYTNECEKGSRCVADAQAVGRGVCVPYQQATQICNTDADCDPKVKGLYCAEEDFTCRMRGKEGEVCAYTLAAGEATLPLLLECDKNLFCNPKSKLCTRLPKNGEACLDDPLPPGVVSRCDPDPALQLVCDGATAGRGGTCRAPGQEGDDCASRACAKDLYCDSVSQLCARLPTFGQSCDGAGRCAQPYYCNFQRSPARCEESGSLHEDCSTVPCKEELYCDASLQTCQAKRADGQACTGSAQCLSGACSTTVNDPTSRCQPRGAGAPVACVGR